MLDTNTLITTVIVAQIGAVTAPSLAVRRSGTPRQWLAEKLMYARPSRRFSHVSARAEYRIGSLPGRGANEVTPS